MVICVVSSAIDTRGGAMPPGKLSVVVRFSVFSIVTSSIRRTTKVNCLIVELKVSVKGSIAA